MSGLTPERIRDAAEVVGLLYGNTEIPATGKNLRVAADKLEREKRIQQIGYALMQIDSPGREHPCVPAVWLRIARGLLDRYPVLATAADSEMGSE